MKFDSQAILKIAEVLQAEVKERGNTFRMVLDHAESARRLSLEIFPGVRMGKGKALGTLITVYTNSAHLQLHHCTGYVASESLGEVIFMAEHEGRVSGLIIVKDAGCSLFAEVEAATLSGDFTKLAPEIMPTAITLSVAEELLPRKARRPSSKSNSSKKAALKKSASRKRKR